jgi:hypothetical protein
MESYLSSDPSTLTPDVIWGPDNSFTQLEWFLKTLKMISKAPVASTPLKPNVKFENNDEARHYN